MAIQAGKTENPDASLPEWAGGVRYVARQPIMDLRGRVYGYELLFRHGTEAAFRGDGNLASRTILDNTVVFGLEKFTGGLSAFVNCTEETLIEELVQVLPPNLAVLEILESVKPSPAVIAACRKLKALGYRLALDDFTWKSELLPLVALASYIKVDFTLLGPAERQAMRRQLAGTSARLVAEKVETQEEYRQASSERFPLFQGYYFCRPVPIENRLMPANRLLQFEILQLVYKDPIDLRKLSRLVKREASITYRLLRLVNSPLYAVRHDVRSIEAALVLVGENTFRRIATLAIASEFNAGQPMEILRMALVRARFCELAASLCALDPTEQYLLGMLSLLPAMLRLPMEELAPALPLRGQICEALTGARNAERSLLAWMEGHEQGDWAASDTVAQSNGLNQVQLIDCYSDSLVWAELALHSAL